MSTPINPSPLDSFSLPSQVLDRQPSLRSQGSEKSSIQPWQETGTPRSPSQSESSSDSSPPFYYRRQQSERVEKGTFVQQWQDMDTPDFPNQPPKSPAAATGGDPSKPHARQEMDSPPPPLPKSQSSRAIKEKTAEVPSVPPQLPKPPQERTLILELSESSSSSLSSSQEDIYSSYQ